MMKHIFAACMLFLLHSPFSYALSGTSDTQLTKENLNGVSVYEELRRQYFIAELYTSKPVDSVAELAGSDSEVQLVVTFLRDMPANKFSQLWIRGAVINNEDSLLNQEKVNLDSFANAFEAQFKAGDTLVLHSNGSGRVLLYLNERQLAQFTSKGFTYLLLNAVVGDVPLSSSFKRSLLAAGKVDDQLRLMAHQSQLSSSKITLNMAQNQPE